MTVPQEIQELVMAIKAHLENEAGFKEGIDEVVSRLAEIPLTSEVAANLPPQIPALRDTLDDAIRCIPRPQLGPIAQSIDAAKHHLHWRVDEGHYYRKGADVGSGYAEGNMHCNLIGPNHAVFPAKDFLLGLFLLGPRILYRDHEHVAPEFYFNLTGPTGWRFDKGPWQDHAAGAMIWNAPNSVHSTRVYDTPFLSVFVWSRDVHVKCRVVPSDDWITIEDWLRDT